jgi:hypothetical protein
MANALHGRYCAVLFNQFDISRYLNKMSAQRNAPELECTTFLASAREYVADFPDGSVALEGFYKTDLTNLNTAEEVFKAAMGSTSRSVVTICPELATTYGKRALLLDAVETKHMADAPAAGLILSNADFRGSVDHGVILAQKTARTTTANGTSHNNGATSNAGAVGHLHVFETSGTAETLDAKIQHSLDDSTWLDLITFAQATGVTSERVKTTGLAAVAQVETATVGGAATASANVIVTVTGVGITGSPLAINVAVLNGDTAAQVATKIRAALNATAAITALYTVGGATTAVILTRTVPAANDATLNIAIDGTTNSTGVPDAPTSASTTAGIAANSVYPYTREAHTIGGSDTPTFTYLVALARIY